MWVSLVGAALCVVIMFIISWPTALITFFFFALLFAYINYRKPGTLTFFILLFVEISYDHNLLTLLFTYFDLI